MKSPLTKRPDAPTPPDMEQILRSSAAWEPEAAPPSDFAAFTRRALERERKPRTNGFLRSPLMAGLASVCVLWVGAILHAPHQAALNAAAPPGVSYAGGVASLPPFASAAHQAASSPALRLASQTARSWEYHAAAVHNISRRRTRKSKTARRLGDTGALENTPGMMAAAPTAAVWETETVERPAWGALVPVPAACAAPSTNEQTGEETGEPAEGEASFAVLPVVLDVALPDPETPMPAPSAAHDPLPVK